MYLYVSDEMYWKEEEQSKNIVIGCVIDMVSYLVAFTRQGVLVGGPYYIGLDPSDCNLHSAQPTVVITPEAAPSHDIQLPSLTLKFVLENGSLEYQKDIREVLWKTPTIKTDRPCPLMIQGNTK